MDWTLIAVIGGIIIGSISMVMNMIKGYPQFAFLMLALLIANIIGLFSLLNG